VIQFVDGDSGEPRVIGRYLGQSQGREALRDKRDAIPLTREPGRPSLEDVAPSPCASSSPTARPRARACARRCRSSSRSNRAASASSTPCASPLGPRGVRIAVALAQDGIIPREEAVLRVDPGSLPSSSTAAWTPPPPATAIVLGHRASPGAASRPHRAVRRRRPGLRRPRRALHPRPPRDTPEDIRGMHAASAVLTIRGGVTSHAA
jgi:pyruvate,orthophosphate dikinase